VVFGFPLSGALFLAVVALHVALHRVCIRTLDELFVMEARGESRLPFLGRSVRAKRARSHRNTVSSQRLNMIISPLSEGRVSAMRSEHMVGTLDQQTSKVRVAGLRDAELWVTFTRLTASRERVLTVNDLHLVSTAVVEAARDSLVIGSGLTPYTPNNSETLRQITIKATVDDSPAFSETVLEMLRTKYRVAAACSDGTSALDKIGFSVPILLFWISL
jgi:hypothetical protein